MKKIFLCLALVVMALSASAQLLHKADELNIRRVEGTDLYSVDVPVRKAPSAPAGTSLWGYYTGNQFGGVGISQDGTGDFGVAMVVPGNGVLEGAKIVAVNIPVYSDTFANPIVWGSTSLTKRDIFAKNITQAIIPGNYNLVMLDEPVAIPLDGMNVGYNFSIPQAASDYDRYAIGVAPGNADQSLYLSLGGQWANYSNQGYVSAMQVYVKDMNLHDNEANILSYNCPAAVVGQTAKATLLLGSDCNNGVKSITYTVDIAGKSSSGMLVLDNPIPAGFNQSGIVDIEFTAPEEIAEFPITITINTVNGKPNEGSAPSCKFNLSTITRKVHRMSVVEEYTGTACGYCPRGWVGMEKVKNNMQENACVIALHHYNKDNNTTADPMYASYYKNLGFMSAPSCLVDRKADPDPYYGMNDEGIEACVNSINEHPAEADIHLKAIWTDANHKSVNISSTTELLTNSKGYTIGYALTADGLNGNKITSSIIRNMWKQTNYYVQYTSAQVGDPELSIFCSGGELGQSAVSLTFNDVMIGSVAGKFTGEQGAGVIFEDEATITLPNTTTDKQRLVPAFDYDKMYVTAIVANAKGEVANAYRVRVMSQEEYDGIVSVGDDNAAAKYYYTIDGKQVMQPQTGLNIVKMSDGSVRKVVVK